MSLGLGLPQNLASVLWVLALLSTQLLERRPRPRQKSHPLTKGPWLLGSVGGTLFSGHLALPHTPTAPHSAQQAPFNSHKSATLA